MRLIVELNNKTAYRFTAKKLERIFKKTIVESAIGYLADKDVEVSVAFVAERDIQDLNKRYRRKNKPTDILSFAEYEHADMFLEASADIFLGQLVACPEYIEKSAKDRNIPFDDELVYVLSHGFLHLLGFSHGKKMFSIQQKVADSLIKTKTK